jgi:PAS domain S-box-containing protein
MTEEAPRDAHPEEEYSSRLAAIVDCSDDAIASKTLDGIITSWNTSAERIFGYTAAEAIGKPITIIIPPDRRSEEVEVLRRINLGERVDHFETVRVRKDGSRVEISLTVSPIKDRQGRIIGASKIARDITAQKRAERELSALLTETERANRAKDEFLAMLGHELRNPLGAISNSLHVLELDADEQTSRFARDVIVRQVRNLTRLVDDLLSMGRVMTGKILLHRGPLELGEAVNRVMAPLRATGLFDRHDVSSELDRVWIDADEVRIEQIVSNLIGNAVKYTPAGGRIRVSVRREKADAVLEVEDSGIGIPEQLVPRIFDLFVQGGGGLDRREGGLGIGLTIVRRLAELHGGSVAARSFGQNRGSRFTVRLPSIPTPARLGGENGAAEGESKPFEPLRILIVEDNRDARETLRVSLAAAGHEVREASHGREAIESASRFRPDVAIVDLGLPEMDGYEVARKLREGEEHRSLRLIALTGYGSPADRKRAQEAGFDAHLLKPLDYEKLASLLRD